MSPVLVKIFRIRWQRLRVYRRPGSVLVDYRILRNFIRIYHMAGAAE
ncbi:YlcG family protein [Lelliottia aquatilis]|nr:YlcG family protein [Lelliottia aquatilis]NTZ47929.1 YlcG family protein [Lelliottia aquatilis]